MDRRGFLSALLAAAVAPDPERLLWTPGKLISIPAVSPYENDLKELQWVILQGCLVNIRNESTLLWFRAHGYDCRKASGLKIGDTIRLRDAFMRGVTNSPSDTPAL